MFVEGMAEKINKITRSDTILKAELSTLPRQAEIFKICPKGFRLSADQRVRSSTPAHGSQEMPIWGPVFRAMSPDENIAKLRVDNLLRYLESIQQK